MNNDKPIVMFDSPEAATYRTDIKGWVSRGGRYYGENEHGARYDGSTHRLCPSCSATVVETGHGNCRACDARRSTERYYALPMVEWDGTTPLATFDDDKFFFSDDEVYDYLAELKTENNGERPEVQLILCEPGKLHLIDEDTWCDDLHEDAELPDTVLTKIAELNEAPKAAPTVTWWAGKKRIDVDALWMIVDETEDVA